MRCGIIAAVAFAGTWAILSLAATGAQAQEWCGYSARPHVIVQCGYSSLQGCENTIGKGAMCFVNPYVAFSGGRPTPSLAAKPTIARG